MHQKVCYARWLIIALIWAGISSCVKKTKTNQDPKGPEPMCINNHNGKQWFVFDLQADMGLQQLAALTGKPVRLLLRWNPELKKRRPYKGMGIGLWLTPEETNRLAAKTVVLKMRQQVYPEVQKVITYKVKGNETINSLVKRFHSSVALMEQMNDISLLTALTPGTVIKIPVIRPKVQAGKRVTNKDTRIYVVKRGDTVWGIARRFHVKSTELQRLNPQIQGNQIRGGMRLYVPVSHK